MGTPCCQAASRRRAPHPLAWGRAAARACLCGATSPRERRSSWRRITATAGGSPPAEARIARLAPYEHAPRLHANPGAARRLRLEQTLGPENTLWRFCFLPSFAGGGLHTLPGSRVALYCAWNHDNSGPSQDIFERTMTKLRQDYPRARLGTFGDTEQ